MKPMIAEKRGTIHTLMKNVAVTRPEVQIIVTAGCWTMSKYM